MAVVTLEPPSHTEHDFSERLLSSCLTERALTNDELSLKCQVLKIGTHNVHVATAITITLSILSRWASNIL